MKTEEMEAIKNLSKRVSSMETLLIELKRTIEESDINSYGEIKGLLQELTASVDYALGLKTITNVPRKSEAVNRGSNG